MTECPQIEIAASVNPEVDDCVQRVTSLIKRSTAAWLDVAKEVRRAKDKLQKEDYALFLKLSCLTAAIGDKLLRIAETTVLYAPAFEQYLERTQGWSPLYEVAKLDTVELVELQKKLDDEPTLPLTRKLVNTVRKASQSVETLGCIVVDMNSVGRMSIEEFEELQTLMHDFARRIDASCMAVKLTLSEKKFDAMQCIIEEADSDNEEATSDGNVTSFDFYNQAA